MKLLLLEIQVIINVKPKSVPKNKSCLTTNFSQLFRQLQIVHKDGWEGLQTCAKQYGDDVRSNNSFQILLSM